MEDDRGGIEMNDYSSCPKRRPLKLHRILVDQLDARAAAAGSLISTTVTARLRDGDGALHYFRLLRNSDRRL